MLAAAADQPDMVRTLLRFKASVNGKDKVSIHVCTCRPRNGCCQQGFIWQLVLFGGGGGGEHG